MEKELTISEAGFKDHLSFCTVMQGSNKRHVELMPAYYEATKHIVSKAKFNTLIILRKALNLVGLADKWALTSRQIHVAKINGETVGAIYTEIKEAPAWSRHQRQAKLDNIFVDPEFRRQGIGKSLVRAAMDFIQAADVNYAEVKRVVNNDESRQLYESMGLRTTHVVMGIDLSKK